MRTKAELEEALQLSQVRYGMMIGNPTEVIKARCAIYILRYTLGYISLDELNEALDKMK